MIEVHISLSDRLLINEAMKKADDKEIGGFGTILYTDSGIPYVDHLYIPRQEVSSGEVDWGMDGVLDFIHYLNEQGDNRENRGIFSWHSHHNMGPFWSRTDEDFISLAGSEGVPYIFSVVLSHKQGHLQRLDVFPKTVCPMIGDGYIQVTYDEDETDFVTYESEKITERRAEVDSVQEAMEKEISAVKAEYEDKIEAIEKEFEEEIDAAKKHVSNMTNSLRGDAKKHVEDIWKERITEKSSLSYFWQDDYSYIVRGGLQGGMANHAWMDDYELDPSDFKEIDDVVAELGEDIMYFEYNVATDSFTTQVAFPGQRSEISMNEARGNYLDVYDILNYQRKNVSVYTYLMSNYDLDSEEGEYEFMSADFSDWEKQAEAANAASLK